MSEFAYVQQNLDAIKTEYDTEIALGDANADNLYEDTYDELYEEIDGLGIEKWSDELRSMHNDGDSIESMYNDFVKMVIVNE